TTCSSRQTAAGSTARGSRFTTCSCSCGRCPMRSQRPETTAGAPASAPARPLGPALPPARRTRHLRSFVWWILLAGIGTVAYRQQLPVSEPSAPARSVPRPEREAFLALSFGRISDTTPEALPSQVFREQLA